MSNEPLRSCGQVTLREIAGEYLLIPMGDTALRIKGLICLTESSAMLWNLLKEGTTEAALQQALLDTYEVDTETARSDTEKFLQTMEDLGLLERGNP